ncbi:hypothetical protein QTO34_000605 [Cnephaeus nilssonii]|uniref:Uncharacterized protein n=1 Tax=Cnephaeus nilssonii TaxID=3371016 RepID=A0AA40ICS9_CNENI|nr:hypothetical protein QTO34_000605 [Eptesicus nilssonii]
MNPLLKEKLKRRERRRNRLRKRKERKRKKVPRKNLRMQRRKKEVKVKEKMPKKLRTRRKMKIFPEEICKVMELVINIINSIIAKALNHHQFKEFLVEMESEYADLLLHNKVSSLLLAYVEPRLGISRVRPLVARILAVSWCRSWEWCSQIWVPSTSTAVGMLRITV